MLLCVLLPVAVCCLAGEPTRRYLLLAALRSNCRKTHGCHLGS